MIKTVIKAAAPEEKGAFGDGKIFVSPVEEVYTVSSGIKESSGGTDGGKDMKEVWRL